jgi:hypothetical protein
VCFLPEILRAVRGQLKAATIEEDLSTRTVFDYPNSRTLEKVAGLLESRLGAAGLGAKEKSALDRCRSGIELLTSSGRQSVTVKSVALAKALIGEKEWSTLLRDIVRNSYRNDLHFLPADDEPPEWSGVPESAVVLFRYPLCCPIQVLDAAQDLELPDWRTCTAELSRHYPAVQQFAARRPLKHATVKTRFLSDLMTRYASMYARLGAPDFSEETIGSFVQSVSKGL